MKYFFYRLEIQDGEHGYYSKGVIQARHEQSAVKQANLAAKYWYEVESRGEREQIENGNSPFPSFNFSWECVVCCVDELREIPKSDYDILKNYL